jgi:hypothetical protein
MQSKVLEHGKPWEFRPKSRRLRTIARPIKSQIQWKDVMNDE